MTSSPPDTAPRDRADPGRSLAPGCTLAPGCILTIESGLQAGAMLVLPPGTHRVGAHLDDDVVVAEAALAAGHFTVEHGGATTLRALAAPLRLSDGTELAAGGTLAVAGTRHFSVGATRFRLDAPPAPRTASRRVAAPLAALAACVAAALVVSAPGSESSAALGRPTPAVAAPVRIAAATPPVADIAEALAGRLRAAGLAELRPAPGADGTVEVSGTLAPERQAGWAEARRWFDATYGGRVMLVDRVTASASVGPLSIAAVQPGGDAPFVIDQSGRRLFVGSEVADGWVLAAIEPTHVTVRRNDQTLAVRF